MVANKSFSVNTDYQATDNSTALQVDVTFTKGSESAEYVFKCRAGEPLGGIVEQP